MNSLYALALLLRRPETSERGQTLVEYALIIALMSVALVAVMLNFGGGVNGLYGVIKAFLDAISGGS